MPMWRARDCSLLIGRSRRRVGGGWKDPPPFLPGHTWRRQLCLITMLCDYAESGHNGAQGYKPVSIARIKREVVPVGVRQAGSHFLKLRGGSDEAAGGVDNTGDTVVGGADDPATVLGGTHADY